MAFMEHKKYRIVTECSVSTYMDVLREHLQMYGNGRVTYISDGNYYQITSDIKYNPELDDSEFELFKDAVRNMANMGWPEYDPLHVEELA